MEIVNKFLNRDVENQKLKLLAEEAEKKLEVTNRGKHLRKKRYPSTPAEEESLRICVFGL